MERIKSLGALVAVFSVAAPSCSEPGAVLEDSAPGWTVADCHPGFDKIRQEFARAVRTAREGDAVYALHPFPSSEEEVLENFLDYLRRSVERQGPSRNMDETRGDYRRVLDAVMEDAVNFDVQQVEEWREARRCSTNLPRDHYYIVRVFESGKETIRGIVLDSGVVVGADFNDTEEGFVSLIQLKDAQRILDSRFGIDNVSDVQFVASFAVPGYGFCATTSPCVAARSGKDVLLLESDLALNWDKPRRLLRLDPEGRRERFTKERINERGLEQNEALWSSVAAEAGERWASVGGRSQTAWFVDPVD